MVASRRQFVVRLNLVGFGAVLLLGAVVALLLRRAAGPDGGGEVVRGTLIFVVLALVAEQAIVRMLLTQVLKPTERATNIAIRVAQGDLGIAAGDGMGGKDALSTSLATMLERLRDLVGTIRQHAHEAAAMSEQIAASTQQMSASTHEVASTTGDNVQ